MGTSAAVALRLQELQALEVRADLLEFGEVTSLTEVARDLRRRLKEARRFDTSDADRREVVEWLLALPVHAEEHVVILWPASLSGARIRYGDLATHYDALWYPSSDDVWILDPRRAWILELDHEELFTWCALGSVNA